MTGEAAVSWKPGRAVIAPLVLTLFIFISIGIMIPITTATVVDRLHEHKRYIGYAVGALTFGGFFGRVIGGRLIDSVGTRMGFRIASLIVILSGFVYLVPVSIPSFLVARALHGLGESMIYTCAATSVINHIPSDRRSRYLGFLGSAVWGGLSIGPALGDVFTRVEKAGVLTIIAGLAGLAVAQLVAPHERSADAPPRRFLPTFPRPAILPGMAVGCYNFGYAAITGFLILHLRSRGIDPRHALTFYGVSVLFGRLALGGIPDKLGPRPRLQPPTALPRWY